MAPARCEWTTTPARTFGTAPPSTGTGPYVRVSWISTRQRPLGSLAARSFRQIWRGEAYAGLRRAFRERWKELPRCGVCASGFEGGDVGRESNAEAVFFQTAAGGSAG